VLVTFYLDPLCKVISWPASSSGKHVPGQREHLAGDGGPGEGNRGTLQAGPVIQVEQVPSSEVCSWELNPVTSKGALLSAIFSTEIRSL